MNPESLFLKAVEKRVFLEQDGASSEDESSLSGGRWLRLELFSLDRIESSISRAWYMVKSILSSMWASRFTQ